ncbi:MAG: 1-(5-phosphoribosyl)-5-[(5-phosphoribosylamino)methylideneamino]imidazole-4-carboxamide isomerase [Candidatus Omnitrophica bacterium]|nr:1-(5-phosphoribosyl)-5-[(5-phosphoribosylamino)methylideneamino]imidazole-4-carboxamide isomerase [Candidatus Omnitrophota bacterium]
MKIIPAIDIIGKKTVRLKKGSYGDKISYDLSPVEAALKWKECGAELLHIIDLDGAKEGRPVNLGEIKKIIKKVKVPLEVGGGYRTKEDIEKALGMGVYRVIVGSKAFEDPDFVKDIFSKYGSKIILSVDADNGLVRTHGWLNSSGMSIFDALMEIEAYGAKQIIYTDISKDGTLNGPNIGMIQKILSVTNLKLFYAGGIKNIAHIRKLKALETKGLIGVIVGRAIYDGTLDLKEAISVG